MTSLSEGTGKVETKFSGIFPPLVTPLKPDHQLDVEGLENLIRHVMEGGVHGLFVLGTTGEGPGLSHAQRDEVVKRACHGVEEGVPVFVGITNSSYEESLRMSERAAAAGATAGVVAPPPYFTTQPEELLDYLSALVERSALPLFLYNIPGATKVMIDWRTAAAAAEISGIIGYKDSSGDMVHFHKVRRATAHLESFTLMVGPEELLAEALLFGADGGISGGANLFPRLYTQLYNACRRMDYDEILALHGSIIEISQNLYELNHSSVGYIKALKAVLAHFGICGNQVTVPFKALAPNGKNSIERVLKRLDSQIRNYLQSGGEVFFNQKTDH